MATENKFKALESDGDEDNSDTPDRDQSNAGSGQIERIPTGPCNRGGNAAACTSSRRRQSSVDEADLVDFMMEYKFDEVKRYADVEKIDMGHAAEELVEGYVMTRSVEGLIDEYIKSKNFPTVCECEVKSREK